MIGALKKSPVYDTAWKQLKCFSWFQTQTFFFFSPAVLVKNEKRIRVWNSFWETGGTDCSLCSTFSRPEIPLLEAAGSLHWKAFRVRDGPFLNPSWKLCGGFYSDPCSGDNMDHMVACAFCIEESISSVALRNTFQLSNTTAFHLRCCLHPASCPIWSTGLSEIQNRQTSSSDAHWPISFKELASWSVHLISCKHFFLVSMTDLSFSLLWHSHTQRSQQLSDWGEAPQTTQEAALPPQPTPAKTSLSDLQWRVP